MAINQGKKLYILQILNILKKYTDYDHRFKQNDIIKYMKLEYDVECERKAIASNIVALQEMGFDIVKDNGYYLAEREFDDSELRLLIDSVIASRHIPTTQSKQLVEKLVNQSSVNFKKQMRRVNNLDRMNHEKTNLLFYNIDMLSEAIENNKKVTFKYNKKNIKFENVPTSKVAHKVNPYQIVVANGKYYLIGNVDKYSNITHFRIEKITNIAVTDEVRKDSKEVEGLENGLNLPEHMMEHVYMFSGKSESITLKVLKSRIDDVIDWLGENIRIIEIDDENYVHVIVRANLNAMKYWSIQFGEIVEVIQPMELREQVKESLNAIINKYRD